MNLPHPVTITTPSQQQITLTSLDIGTIDIPSRQIGREWLGIAATPGEKSPPPAVP